ncbi:MAG: glycosyltransferase family protein [candidate division NC10 bacterium]
MTSKVLAIIQARMASTRLSRKVMAQIHGEPMLTRVVRRTKRARTLEEVLVATSTSEQDDAIEDLCSWEGWSCFRGKEEDVLDRYYQAANAYEGDPIVRVTADCPLIDPGLIDEVVTIFHEGEWDYVSNTLEPRSFPRGLDTEVLSFKALERAWQEDKTPRWREHVTPYLYRHPDLFRLRGVRPDEDFSSLRWTVDTAQDLELARRIYAGFGGDDHFTWRDVLALLENHPEWIAINRDVPQKTVD